MDSSANRISRRAFCPVSSVSPCPTAAPTCSSVFGPAPRNRWRSLEKRYLRRRDLGGEPGEAPSAARRARVASFIPRLSRSELEVDGVRGHPDDPDRDLPSFFASTSCANCSGAALQDHVELLRAGGVAALRDVAHPGSAPPARRGSRKRCGTKARCARGRGRRCPRKRPGSSGRRSSSSSLPRTRATPCGSLPCRRKDRRAAPRSGWPRRWRGCRRCRCSPRARRGWPRTSASRVRDPQLAARGGDRLPEDDHLGAGERLQLARLRRGDPGWRCRPPARSSSRRSPHRSAARKPPLFRASSTVVSAMRRSAETSGRLAAHPGRPRRRHADVLLGDQHHRPGHALARDQRPIASRSLSSSAAPMYARTETCTASPSMPSRTISSGDETARG